MTQSSPPMAFRLPEMITEAEGTLLPQQEAYLFLVHAAQAVRAPVLDLLEARGLSGKQNNVLRSIRRAGPDGATVNDLRHQMTDPRADISRLIDRLERDGFVERRNDDGDRRVVRVVLSQKGADVLNDIDGPLHEIFQTQFTGFNPQELSQLTALLRKIKG